MGTLTIIQSFLLLNNNNIIEPRPEPPNTPTVHLPSMEVVGLQEAVPSTRRGSPIWTTAGNLLHQEQPIIQTETAAIISTSRPHQRRRKRRTPTIQLPTHQRRRRLLRRPQRRRRCRLRLWFRAGLRSRSRAFDESPAHRTRPENRLGTTSFGGGPAYSSSTSSMPFQQEDAFAAAVNLKQLLREVSSGNTSISSADSSPSYYKYGSGSVRRKNPSRHNARPRSSSMSLTTNFGPTLTSGLPHYVWWVKEGRHAFGSWIFANYGPLGKN